MISEKIDYGKVFETFSDTEDKIENLKKRRKPSIYLLIFAIIMAIWGMVGLEPFFEFILVGFTPLSNYRLTPIILSFILAIVSILRLVVLSRMIKSIGTK